MVAGTSLGGLGAVHYAEAHPELFQAVASFSGVLDPVVDAGFDADPMMWGDREAQADIWAAHDTVAMAEALEGKTLHISWQDGQPGALDPPGTTTDWVEEWVAEMNEVFVAHLEEPGIPATIETGPGTHTWPYRDRSLGLALPLMMAALER
jgi:diacylglycerol O-acyltransferase/trehalose O-mycolyltransferase